MAKWLCYIYENMADFEIALTLHCVLHCRFQGLLL